MKISLATVFLSIILILEKTSQQPNFLSPIFSVLKITNFSDWKTFCPTGENPDHLVTTKENLNEELLENSEKRDDLEMKVVQIVIYDHQKNI